MDQRQKRQEEIEAKRARLAELKRARELRNAEKQTGRLSIGTPDLAQPVPSRAERQQDLDNLINSLVGEGRTSTSTPRLSGSPARLGSRLSRPSSTLGSRPLSHDRSGSRPRVSDGSGDQTGSHVQSSAQSEAQYATSATQTQVASLPAIPIQAPTPPLKKVIETYDHAVQVDESLLAPPPDRGDGQRAESDLEDEQDWDSEGKPVSRRQKEKYEQIRQDLRKEIEEELRAALQPTSANESTPTSEDKFPIRSLNREELDAVTGSKDFMDFIDQSTKVIERALDEPYDLLTDYAQGIGEIDEEEDGFKGRRGRRIKEIAQYWDERWSKRRMISDISFSPKHPELLLASYTKNPSAPHDPDGLLQIWNSHMPSRPEYTFHASSDILTAKFSPFHPSLLVGGCYSGQVLVWDTRSRSPIAVQKTPLTGQGHTHPVYSIDVVGTQNANNVISCSTDGVVCSWSIDMLAQPQEYLELHAPPPAKTEDVAPLCIAFPHSDPTYFLAGTEEGTIYTCHRYERAGAKAGVDSRVRYTGHTAPVMSLDFHSATGHVDLGDLVLSSSMDWSVKLWRVKPPAATGGTSASGTASIVSPVLDFPRDDLVYDAKWSPIRPGVFAAVDGAGTLELWDVNVDIEVPVATAKPSDKLGVANAWAKRSLNRVAWERQEGKHVAVGGLDGVVTVFEVGGELGGKEGLKSEEWSRVKKVVGRAEAQANARGVINGNTNSR